MHEYTLINRSMPYLHIYICMYEFFKRVTSWRLATFFVAACNYRENIYIVQDCISWLRRYSVQFCRSGSQHSRSHCATKCNLDETNSTIRDLQTTPNMHSFSNGSIPEKIKLYFLVCVSHSNIIYQCKYSGAKRTLKKIYFLLCK